MKPTWLEAEEEFKSFFTGKESYVFPFHDARMAKGTGGSKKIFTTSHPSDCLVIHKGVFFFAEIKKSENPETFPFANVKPSQWAAAIQTIAASGLYLFFLRKDPEQVWYVVPAENMLAFQKLKKSVKWVDLEVFKWDTKQSQILVLQQLRYIVACGAGIVS